MADYTVIQNDSIEPDAPALSRIAFAFRDNPIAIAEGAPDAPRIAGQISPALRNGGVPDGELGAEKFQTGTDERAWVLGRVAAATRGVVGTYGLFRFRSGEGVDIAAANAIVPGANLSYASLPHEGGAASDAGVPSGSWRNMGNNISPLDNSIGIFLRVT